MTTHPIRSTLERCADLVDERGQPYGGLEDNFGRAAAIASVLLGMNITSHDIAMVLHAVKLARIAGNQTHADSYDDGINYLAFARHFAMSSNPLTPAATASPLPADGPGISVHEMLEQARRRTATGAVDVPITQA